MKFSFRDRVKSFKYALEGLMVLMKNEHNAWIHFFAGIGAISAGIFFDIDFFEWLWVILCIGLVFMAELFNSALEEICDLVHPEQHPAIKKVKDLSAAAVLVIAFAAAVIGFAIFIPKVLAIMN